MIKLNQHKIFFYLLLSLPLPNVRTFISLNPKAKRIMVLAVENDKIFGYIAEKSPIFGLPVKLFLEQYLILVNRNYPHFITFNPLLKVHSLTYCMKF